MRKKNCFRIPPRRQETLHLLPPCNLSYSPRFKILSGNGKLHCQALPLGSPLLLPDGATSADRKLIFANFILNATLTRIRHSCQVSPFRHARRPWYSTKSGRFSPASAQGVPLKHKGVLTPFKSPVSSHHSPGLRVWLDAGTGFNPVQKSGQFSPIMIIINPENIFPGFNPVQKSGQFSPGTVHLLDNYSR